MPNNEMPHEYITFINHDTNVAASVKIVVEAIADISNISNSEIRSTDPRFETHAAWAQQTIEEAAEAIEASLAS